MKQFTLNNESIDASSVNYVNINLSSIPKDIKIINAILSISASVTTSRNYVIKYSNDAGSSWDIESIYVDSTNPALTLDISDEVQDTLNRDCSTLTLYFEGVKESEKDNVDITLDNTSISLDIQYSYLHDYKDTTPVHSIDIGKSGKVSIDMDTSRLNLSTPLSHSTESTLPVSVVANYHSTTNASMPKDMGLPEGWSLNLNQFLVEEEDDNGNLKFTYIDSNGNNEVIEEKYYYRVNSEKKYISRVEDNEKEASDKNLGFAVDMDGKYVYRESDGNGGYTEHKVETELTAPSGLKLVSSIEDISGAELVEYEPEELYNVKASIEELETNIKSLKRNISANKDQLMVLALTKETLDRQHISQVESLVDNEKLLDKEYALYRLNKPYFKEHNYAERYWNHYGGTIPETDMDAFYKFLAENTDASDNPASTVLVPNSTTDYLHKQDIQKIFEAIQGFQMSIALGHQYDSSDYGTIKTRRKNIEDSKVLENEIELASISRLLDTHIGSGCLEEDVPIEVIQPEETTTEETTIDETTEETSSENTESELSGEETTESTETEIVSVPYAYQTIFSNEDISTFISNHDTISLSYYDVINIESQIKSILDTNEEYYTTLEKYEDNLKKLEYQRDSLEAQIPVHYLYSKDNIIYGFGKSKNENNEYTNVYRLVLITDAYENSLSINYEDLNSYKIESIVDNNEKSITLEYDEDTGMLCKVIDTRDRVTTLSVDTTLNSIERCGSRTILSYTDGVLIGVLDSSGFGAKFTRSNEDNIERLSIERLSIFSSEGIEDGAPHYLEGITGNMAEFVNNNTIIDTITISFDNYTTTTITDDKGKSTTYLLDRYGKVRTVYENDYTGEEKEYSSNVTTFEYNNDTVTRQIFKLPNSTNYLSDTHFDTTSITYEEALQLGTITLGDDSIPYSYPVYQSYYSMPEGECVDSVMVSAENLSLINADTLVDNCNHNVLVLTGWAKANSNFVKDLDDENTYSDSIENTKFELRAEAKYVDDENIYTFRKPFDWRNTSWQYNAVVLDLEDSKSVESITCYIDYTGNYGTIYFTDLELKAGDYTETKYNDEKLPMSKKSGHSKYETSYVYDEDNRLIKEVLTNIETGETYKTKYEYNKQGAVIRTEDYNGIIKENMYNEQGSIIKSMTYHKDEPANILCEETHLDEQGNKVKEVNEFGDTLSEYEYLEGTGIVSSTKDTDGVKTSYGYSLDDTLLQTTTTINGEDNTNIFGYTLDHLTRLSHNDFDITYSYNNEGKKRGIAIAEENYLSKEYSDYEEITTLNNGEEYRYTYDRKGNLLGTYYRANAESEYVLIRENIYDIYNNLLYSKDYSNGEEIHTYTYDSFGNVVNKVISKDGVEILKISSTYDDKHKKELSTKITLGAKELNYSYAYDETPNEALLSTTSDMGQESITYDKLGRTKSISNGSLTKEYSYLKNGSYTSNLVSKVRFGDNSNLTYKYDTRGNITEARENNVLKNRYFYDSLSRIIREDNKEFGETSTFTYDASGNIICKNIYAYTLNEDLEYEEIVQSIPYIYPMTGWRDQLLSYNGESCEYDSLGNPTTYRDNELKWSHYRQLDSYENIASYTYNADGIRTSKYANEYTTSYILNGTKILQQKDSINTFTFFYDTDGVIGFHLSNNIVDADYFYKKNAQGDIIGIYDNNGVLIAKYEYNTFGECITKYLSDLYNYCTIEERYDISDTSNINRFIACKNPFRYRSYYYDYETNLYYLNSRYYDPETGRFINADDIATLDTTKIALNGLNLYAYCLNNPVNERDESGYFLAWLFAASILVGAIVGGATSGVKAYNDGARGGDLIASIVGGSIMGGAMGAIMTLGGAVSLGAASGISATGGILISLGLGLMSGIQSYSLETIISPSKTWNFKDFAYSGATGTLKGLFTFLSGLVSGVIGAQDNIILNPLIKNAQSLDTNITYSLAKIIMGRKLFTTPVGEFMLKTGFGLFASGIRGLIDKIFG